MGFIGLQGLSYSQTIQLICQGDPSRSLSLGLVAPVFVYRESINIRLSKIHPAAWHQAITNFTITESLFVVLFE